MGRVWAGWARRAGGLYDLALAGTIEQAVEMFRATGWVAWPLSVLSVVAVGLCFERMLFFASLRRTMTPARIAAMASALRRNDERALARRQGDGILGLFVSTLIEAGGRGQPIGESAVMLAGEAVRPRLERFLPFLSTTITAAPMLGILGTVTGIIKSFGLLGGGDQIADPASMAVGISEALYTTAFGLVVALVVLFPYNAFRRSSDRALAALETMGAAALEARSSQSPAES